MRSFQPPASPCSPFLPRCFPTQIVIHVADLLLPLTYQGGPLTLQAQEVASLVVLHIQEEAVRLQDRWPSHRAETHSQRPTGVPHTEWRHSTYLLNGDKCLAPLVPDLLLLCLLLRGERRSGYRCRSWGAGRKGQHSRHPLHGRSPLHRSSSGGYSHLRLSASQASPQTALQDRAGDARSQLPGQDCSPCPQTWGRKR